jgi:hypothetical protein
VEKSRRARKPVAEGIFQQLIVILCVGIEFHFIDLSDRSQLALRILTRLQTESIPVAMVLRAD